MAKTQPPNILLFIPDAMQAQVTRPDHPCRTPNFDQVAQRGIRFERAYTCTPVCSPARASMLTGLLPHNHGVLQVEHCTDDDQSVLRREHPHWAHRLSAAGYRTGYFGKWHVERTNRLEDFGWQVNGCDATSAFRDLGAGAANEHELVKPADRVDVRGPEGYNDTMWYGVTDVPAEGRPFGRITNMAMGYLDQVTRDSEPWACVVSFSEPNTPVVAGRSMWRTYDPKAIALPENFRDQLEDRPGLYRRQRRVLASYSEDQWRGLRACYYALVSEIDAQVGRILDQLRAAGQLDNTIVIIMSDHGRYLGAHGFDAHNFGAFEEAYNIPLIVAGPGIATDHTTEARVNIHDLCPTLLELAGAKPIPNLDAKSFAPLLADPVAQAKHFQQAYGESHGVRLTLTQRIVWDGHWKFIYNGFDEDELYDLAADPHEMTNLAQRPEHAATIRRLTTVMWQYVNRTRDRALLGTHYQPMRMAAVGPNAGR